MIDQCAFNTSPLITEMLQSHEHVEQQKEELRQIIMETRIRLAELKATIRRPHAIRPSAG